MRSKQKKKQIQQTLQAKVVWWQHFLPDATVTVQVI